jgi:hypothetical protein
MLRSIILVSKAVNFRVARTYQFFPFIVAYKQSPKKPIFLRAVYKYLIKVAGIGCRYQQSAITFIQSVIHP